MMKNPERPSCLFLPPVLAISLAAFVCSGPFQYGCGRRKGQRHEEKGPFSPKGPVRRVEIRGPDGMYDLAWLRKGDLVVLGRRGFEPRTGRLGSKWHEGGLRDKAMFRKSPFLGPGKVIYEYKGEPSIQWQIKNRLILVNDVKVGVDISDLLPEEASALISKHRGFTRSVLFNEAEELHPEVIRAINDLPSPHVTLSLHGFLGPSRELYRLKALGKKLVGLVLDGPYVEDLGMIHVSALENLVLLDLESSNLTGAGLRCIGPLERLRSLCLAGTDTDDGSFAHIPNTKGLHTLNLTGSNIGARSMAAIGKMKSLVHLDMAGLDLSDDDILPLAGLPRLRHLDISRTSIGDAALVHLGKLTGLEGLYLEGTKITDAGLESLEGLHRLVVLAVGDCRVSDKGAKRIASFEKLELLYLNHTYLTDEGLSKLKGLDRCKILNLAHTYITDKGAASLSSLKNLMRLDLTSANITDETAITVGGLAELVELHLADTLISDKGLAPLEKLKKLALLDLSYTTITTEGLVHLAQLKGMEHLALRDTRVSGAGFVHIGKLVGLRSIDLDGTGLSKEDLAVLSRLEAMRVMWLHTKPGKPADLKPLSSLRFMRDLTLAAELTEKKDLAPLAVLKDLRRLSLSIHHPAWPGIEVLGAFKRLRSLHIVSSLCAGDVFELSTLTSLTELGIKLDMANADVMSHIGKLHRLTHLELSGFFEEAGLVHLARLARLRTLDIFGHDPIKSGAAYFTGLRNLRHLSLSRDAGDSWHIRGHTKLRTLFHSTSHSLHRICDLRNLRSLSLAPEHKTSIPHLGKLKGLRALVLGKIAPSDIKHLAGLSGLRRLRFLDSCRADGPSELKLPPLGSLEILIKNASHCLNERRVEGLSGLVNLRALSIVMDPKACPAVGRLHWLKRLSRSDVLLEKPDLDLSSIRHLFGLRYLKDLRLGAFSVQGDAVVRMAPWIHLTSLHITGALLDDSAAKLIGRVPFLRSLAMWNVKGITGKGKEHLQKLKHLRHLFLVGAGIEPWLRSRYDLAD